MVDVDPGSSPYGQLVGQVDMPNAGDELHHFGWNACSACLCPYARTRTGAPLSGGAGHPLVTYLHHRYQARSAQAKNRQGDRTRRIAARTGYSRPHTVHCGPDGIYVSALGAPTATARAASSCSTIHFDVLGTGNRSRPAAPGLRFLVAPRLRHVVTSEWGTPSMIENGVDPNFVGRRLRPPAARAGICASVATSRPSISAPRSRWYWSCGRRTILPKPTGLPAW